MRSSSLIPAGTGPSYRGSAQIDRSPGMPASAIVIVVLVPLATWRKRGITGQDSILGRWRNTAMENDELTRRDFVSTVAAGLVAAAGTELGAQGQVTETNVEIKTPDGTCDAAFITPATGAHPAVIIWPDAFGLRPSMRNMAKRLAGAGYRSEERRV